MGAECTNPKKNNADREKSKQLRKEQEEALKVGNHQREDPESEL